MYAFASKSKFNVYIPTYILNFNLPISPKVCIVTTISYKNIFHFKNLNVHIVVCQNPTSPSALFNEFLSKGSQAHHFAVPTNEAKF